MKEKKKKKSISGDLLMCDVDMEIEFHFEFNPWELLRARALKKRVDILSV